GVRGGDSNFGARCHFLFLAFFGPSSPNPSPLRPPPDSPFPPSPPPASRHASPPPRRRQTSSRWSGLRADPAKGDRDFLAVDRDGPELVRGSLRKFETP